MKLLGAEWNLSSCRPELIIRLGGRVVVLPGSNKMLSRIWDFFFGCSHQNYSFPISAKSVKNRNAAACETGTYVVCLNCGKELPYDWNTMKVVTTREQAGLAHAEESYAVK